MDRDECERYKAAIERGEMTLDQMPQECVSILASSAVSSAAGSALKRSAVALAARGLLAPAAVTGLLGYYLDK